MASHSISYEARLGALEWQPRPAVAQAPQTLEGAGLLPDNRGRHGSPGRGMVTWLIRNRTSLAFSVAAGKQRYCFQESQS